MIVVDGSGQILGRLASLVAKRLLQGERVVVINAEKIVISGRRSRILREYNEWFRVRGRTNPRKGPKHFRRPDDLVRQVIGGMLPMKKTKGREAFRRLRVYVGIPPEFSGVQAVSFPEASSDRLRGSRMSVGELSRYLGAKF
ncbi:MAG: 50S ribosomal protein L13 [Candidatus Hadarchaeales archaeon]